MNYDDVFGDNIYEDNIKNVEKDLIDLGTIFKKNGFDKQLTTLALANCELMGLITLYKEIKDNESNYRKLIQAMAVVSTLIETFISSDDEIYDIFQEVRMKYIEKELGSVDMIPINIKNRIAYLQHNKKL